MAWGTQYDLEPTVPAFFESPVSLVLILWLTMLAVTVASIQREGARLGSAGIAAWIAVVLIGGPLGVIAWFTLGRRPQLPPATSGPSPFS
jgi:hypothetical protein